MTSGKPPHPGSANGLDGTRLAPRPSRDAAYETILLPLDGSELSERAIPHAAALARTFGARLLVLRVVAPLAGPGDLAFASSPIYQSALENEERDALTYAKDRAAEISLGGVRAEGICHLGEPAAAVIACAAEASAGLIVIATHGRTGAARWLFGSVAARVLQGATVPVLVLRPDLAP
ncbi:MAG: universal stress protein [Acidobacteriota bacterium]